MMKEIEGCALHASPEFSWGFQM